MDSPSGMVTPGVESNILSAIIHLLGVTILAHLISRQTILRGNLTLRDLSWLRICVLLIFIDSWLFIFSSGVLIGSGLERNDVSCSMGILLCIIFYGSSKLLIYTFLCTPLPCILPSPMTKLHQRSEFTPFGNLAPNHEDCSQKPTLRASLPFLDSWESSRSYSTVGFHFWEKVCGGSRKFRPHFLHFPRQVHVLYRFEEASKHRTLDLRFASYFRSPFIPLLIGQNSLVNAFLTGMFLWPVTRSSFRNNRVRRLAVRTLWSALIALTTSCVNILILTLMHGRQLGWVCLGSCGTDVGSPTQRI